MTSRKFTNKILDLMFDGVIDPTWLAQALASWLSEAEMAEFYSTYLQDSEKEEEEEEEEV